MEGETNNLGMDITGLDIAFNSMNNHESMYGRSEEKINKDMADMLEYAKMLTEQITDLRKRTRAAQGIIN